MLKSWLSGALLIPKPCGNLMNQLKLPGEHPGSDCYTIKNMITPKSYSTFTAKIKFTIHTKRE